MPIVTFINKGLIQTVILSKIFKTVVCDPSYNHLHFLIVKPPVQSQMEK